MPLEPDLDNYSLGYSFSVVCESSKMFPFPLLHAKNVSENFSKIFLPSFSFPVFSGLGNFLVNNLKNVNGKRRYPDLNNNQNGLVPSQLRFVGKSLRYDFFVITTL